MTGNRRQNASTAISQPRASVTSHWAARSVVMCASGELVITASMPALTQAKCHTWLKRLEKEGTHCFEKAAKEPQ